MTALVRHGTYVSEVQANWGRWVARCGHCRYGAEQLQRLEPDFLCSFCGMVTEVIWPSPEMAEGVERLLKMRPDPATRNWKPGETLPDLNMENAAHGVYDSLASLELTPGTALLSVTDNRIRIDQLPKRLPNQPRRELDA